MNSSRKKEKRPRTSSDDASNSFVNNVTSRMSGLLPAAITSWFSSPSTPSANGSAQVADDSSSDEAQDFSPTPAPMPKRMRFTVGDEYNQYDVNCPANLKTKTERRTTYSTIQYLPKKDSHRWEANNESTPLRPTEIIDRIEKDKTFQSPTYQHSAIASTSSGPIKRKSLFDIEHSEVKAASTARNPNQPCFKPSLLGSPFYPGRTNYGGAAQYVYQPNIRQRKELKVKAANSSADNSISNSARRIMDLLEHYSSPINDSRRIPRYTRPSTHNINNTTTSPLDTSNGNLTYKTQELHVPNIASILRIKQRSRLLDTTTAARQILASHSSTTDYLPYPSPQGKHDRDQPDKESSNKLTTKVKTRLTRPKRGEQYDIDTELSAPLNLPSAVLQIDQEKLPKFSLEPPAVVKPVPVARPAVAVTAPSENKCVQSTPVAISRKNDSFSSHFKFASPVTISVDNLDQNQAATSTGYTFGRPACVIQKSEEKEKDTASKPLVNNQNKDWKCPDCWISNKPEAKECVCCGAKNQDSNSANVNSNLLKPVAKKADGWKCEECWVSNDAGAAQCVCCGVKQPNASTETSATSVPATNHLFNKWKCNDCWIQNENDATQCVACGGSRPQSKPQSQTTDSFKITLSKQTDKWECPNCLVRNDNEKTKCACCETEKPGSSTAAAKTTFNFGTSATAFKFGISNAQVQNTGKPVELKAIIEQSETNNNVISKTPTFTFGLPAKKCEDQLDVVKKSESITNSTTKLNFSFGVPKETSQAKTLLPTPTVSTTTTSLKTYDDNEKAQEVPKVNFSAIETSDTPKSFANFQRSSIQGDNTSVASPPSVENKTEVTGSSSVATTISSSPTFTFGAVKPASNLYSAPAPVSATVTPTSATTFGVPTCTTATFLDKSGPTTAKTLATPTVDQTNTSTSNSGAKPSSLFSFGSNSQSTAPKTDQPKFNFSFGGNADSALFKPPQSTTGNNSSNNNFTLPTAFGPANNNALTNSLSAVNGLPASTSSGTSGTVTTQVSNALPSGGGIFGSSTQKGSIWPASDNAPSGLFSASVPTSTPQKPAFSFGSSTPFNTGALSPFGATTQAAPTFGAITTQATPSFGANNQLAPAFGASTQSTPAFGVSTQSTPAFGASTQSTPTFGASTQSTPTFGTNTQPAPNFGANTQPTPTFGTNTQPVPGFGAASQSSPAFGSAAQSSPAFGSMAQPVPAFGSQTSAFGASAQSPSAFGSTTTAFGTGSSAPAFSASAQAPSFGASQQSSSNLFGMGGVNGPSQASPFGQSSGGTSAPSLFGAAAMNAPAGGLFGSTAAATPTFGSPNPVQPTFEAPLMTSTPAPAFNFTPQSGAVFGFGQQTQQPPGAGIYSFGSSGAGGPAMGGGGMSFNMGSGAATQARRVRKAVRRTSNLRQ